MGGASFNDEGVHDAEACGSNPSTRKMRKQCSMKPTHVMPGENEASVRQYLPGISEIELPQSTMDYTKGPSSD